MTKDTQDFSHLRALAEAGNVTGYELADMNESDFAACLKRKREFAALCTAAAIISLLDKLEALQAELARLKAESYAHQGDALMMTGERDAALARLKALQAVNIKLTEINSDALGNLNDLADAKNAELEALTEIPIGSKLYLAAGASLEPSALQDENAKLITALAECRGAFPVPSQGSELDDWYVGAVSDPLAVPEYVRACVRASPVETSQAQPDTWVDDGGWAFPMEQPSQAGELSIVDRSNAVNLARNIITNGWDENDISTAGIRLLADGVMRMDAAIIAAINAKEQS